MTNIFSINNASINSVFATKDESIYIACSNNNIYSVMSKNIKRERDKTAEALGDDIQKSNMPKFNKINAGTNIEQLVLSRSQKYLFMAVKKDRSPGCVRITHFPLKNQALYEIQPHY